VRALGQKMVAEHTRINGELTQIADAKQVRLSKAMDPANRTLYDEMEHMSGAAFDRQYAIAQLNIHRMGNALYMSEAQNGQDADVKAFAARGVAVGNDHLQHATRLLQGLPTSSAQ
jgi:putative membrane protein